jgi:hypothetical protein
MADTTTIVDTYLAMWNETDSKRRARLIEQAWAGNGHYVDPMLEAEGHAALGDMVAGVQAKFPGHRFRRRSGVDTHHDQLRFAWDLVSPDGTVVVAGIDVGALAVDGRLQRITGFFGEAPAMDAA